MSSGVFIVLGSGMQGTCAAYDLARHGAREVRIADVRLDAAKSAADRVRGLGPTARVSAWTADARKPETLAPLFEDASVLLSAVPYFLNLPVAEACVAAGVSYCDLGGNTSLSRQLLALHARAADQGVSLVPDCGLAPGLAERKKFKPPVWRDPDA